MSGKELQVASTIEPERFWSRVTKLGPDKCWEWTGKREGNGHGLVSRRKGCIRAHRLSYYWLVGPIPNGNVCLHSCDNPICVNPAHLYLKPHRIASREGAIERFWSQVQKTDSCWIWNGQRDAYGYGVAYDGKRQVKAHRQSMIISGINPEGWLVMHSCDNPPCVNPAHLSLGTQKENMRDASIRRRVHFGEGNVHSKLTEEQVINIRAAIGKSHAELAREHGVTGSTILKIRAGDRWAHILP